jgi:hypothetical protein
MTVRDTFLLALDLLAIIGCGAAGGFAGYAAARALDLAGVAAALAAAGVAMFVATAAWVAGYLLLRAVRLVR